MLRFATFHAFSSPLCDWIVNNYESPLKGAPWSFWGTSLLFVCLAAVPAHCSVYLHIYFAQMPSQLCLSPDLPLVSGCLGVHIRILSAVHQHFYLFIFSISSPASSFSSHSHKQTDTHSLTQLISPSHAHSSSRMWPCLIVYHAHLFSLRDVTIAYLFSSGLPSHIKMIDSFHSLHIFKLYLISSFPLAFKFLLFPCLKVIMLPRHVIIHSRDCFFS